MQAHYRDLTVSADPSGRCLRIAFRLSLAPPSPQPLLGYQIFDDATDLLLEEGPRTPLLAAPSSQPVSLEINLPPENGDYRILLSPLPTADRWLYQLGGAFLEINASRRDGALAHLRWRLTTQRALQARLLARAALRALYFPFRAVGANASLIRTMVKRDLLSRYRGSLGGVLWTLLNPLLLMLTYFFVFGIVLEARFGPDPSRSSFVLYFLAGLLPWLAFSEALGRASSILLEHANFIKKLVFPVEILPLTPAISGLVTLAFALSLFLLYLLLARGALPLTALWLPAYILPQLMLTLGLVWFLSALGVFVRDLPQIMSYLLTLWFFLTPICYPETALPAASLPLLARNPMFLIVRGYRRLLLEGLPPEWLPLLLLLLFSFAVMVLGYAWFHRLRRTFPDVL